MFYFWQPHHSTPEIPNTVVIFMVSSGIPTRSSKPPRDLNLAAKFIVDLATGQIRPDPETGKNPAAVALGRLGGQKGGRARADKLSPARRKEIAKRAAAARWKSPDSGTARSA